MENDVEFSGVAVPYREERALSSRCPLSSCGVLLSEYQIGAVVAMYPGGSSVCRDVGCHSLVRRTLHIMALAWQLLLLLTGYPGG